MFTKYDPKILDVVADAKQKKSLKRKRRLINFWRRLTPEQLNLIHRQVQVWQSNAYWNLFGSWLTITLWEIQNITNLEWSISHF